jgi:hypothetical protein
MCALAAGEVRPAALGQVRQRRVRRGDRGIERVEITALVGHAHDRLPKVQCDQPSSDGSGPKIGVRRRCRRITQDTHPASSTGIDKLRCPGFAMACLDGGEQVEVAVHRVPQVIFGMDARSPVADPPVPLPEVTFYPA